MSDLAAAGTRAVIFDIGSGQCKAGLSGEQAPRSVISTVVGYPKFKLVMFGVRHKDCYIGEEAQSKRGILSFTYPMENGVVTSWDDMEKIWRYLYEQELKMKPSERPALLTETALNPLWHREKMAETMFESFQVPALFVTLQALTALYASARTTGLVLDSGDGVTVTVPVYKGCYLLHGITRRDFAGKGVTKYLARLLSEAGQSFVSTGCQGPGVGRMVLQSVAKCREHIQPDMLRNVLLSGGSTLFRGFKERLLKELQTGIPSTTPVKIISPQDRMHSVWIGASILASLRTFRNMWVTREDYDEVGPTVLQRKCF
ncbi:actin-1-like isoform X4 [Haliaeetus albicilla]|uniref:actin-1-like isoform X4 n=1 Tax=Haliaeetus albicilla TaxID=8969 RepID=UPI0037E7A9F3